MAVPLKKTFHIAAGKETCVLRGGPRLPPFLHLLPHYHRPEGSSEIARTRFKDTGYYLLGGGPRRDTKLQELLTKLIDSKWKRYKKSMAVALVDLNKDKPAFAGFNSMTPVYGASVPKIISMFSSYQLQYDVFAWTKRNPGATQGEMVKALEAEWKRHGLTAKGRETGWPKLREIFAIEDSESGLPKFKELAEDKRVALVKAYDKAYDAKNKKKKKEIANKLSFVGRRHIMIRWSDNTAASLLNKTIGWPYMASAVWQTGLFNPEQGYGLWMGSDYGGGSWSAGRKYRAWKGRGGNNVVNALALADFMTLLRKDTLISKYSSRKMKKLMERAQSTVWNAIKDKYWKKDPTLPEDEPQYAPHDSFGKLGYYENYNHDAAWVKHDYHGKDLEYVVALLTYSYSANKKIDEMFISLDDLIKQNN